MRKLYLKLLLAAFPILFVLVLYISTDPFKVIYHYKDFTPAGTHGYVSLNKDYTSTETFLRNFPAYHYNAYIFGNSRSKYYSISEWEKYIGNQQSFHFDAARESLYGVERKMALIHKTGGNIKNALFVIDPELLAVTTNNDGHIFHKHYAQTGERWLDFQLIFFKDFLDPEFITAYIRLLCTHKASQEALTKGLLEIPAGRYVSSINEESYPDYEEQIAKQRDSFYTPRMHLFYERDTVQATYEPMITAAQKQLLKSIKDILAENHTNYKIVISPLYNQKKIAPADLNYLKSVFGNDNVYDFSGINEMTSDIYNYYENSHYRPQVANKVMEIIYAVRR